MNEIKEQILKSLSYNNYRSVSEIQLYLYDKIGFKANRMQVENAINDLIKSGDIVELKFIINNHEKRIMFPKGVQFMETKVARVAEESNSDT